MHSCLGPIPAISGHHLFGCHWVTAMPAIPYSFIIKLPHLARSCVLTVRREYSEVPGWATSLMANSCWYIMIAALNDGLQRLGKQEQCILAKSKTVPGNTTQQKCLTRTCAPLHPPVRKQLESEGRRDLIGNVGNADVKVRQLGLHDVHVDNL